MEDRAAAATQPPQLMRDWTQLDNDPSSSIVEAARLSLWKRNYSTLLWRNERVVEIANYWETHYCRIHLVVANESTIIELRRFCNWNTWPKLWFCFWEIGFSFLRTSNLRVWYSFLSRIPIFSFRNLIIGNRPKSSIIRKKASLFFTLRIVSLKKAHKQACN